LRKMISYRELSATVNKYHQYPDVSNGEKIYEDYMRRRNVWDNLDKLRETDVKEVIVAFPNKWKTRIPNDCVPVMTKTLRRLSDPLAVFKTETLLKCDFKKGIELGGLSKTIGNLIPYVFAEISRVKARNREFGFTGTTKVLHMIAPDLFVMCDQAIASGYGYAGNHMGYRKFLEEMQRFGRDIVDSYLSEFKVDETQAIKEILRLCNDVGKTLPKTLDEFNYATYTLGIH
jgi:hypothetical protein